MNGSPSLRLSQRSSIAANVLHASLLGVSGGVCDLQGCRSYRELQAF